MATNVNPDGLDSYRLGWQGEGNDVAELGLNSNELDEAYLVDGFLTAYNTTAFEEDFNRYAEYLFALPEALAGVQHHPKVREKTRLTVDFYRRLGVAAPKVENGP